MARLPTQLARRTARTDQPTPDPGAVAAPALRTAGRQAQNVSQAGAGLRAVGGSLDAVGKTLNRIQSRRDVIERNNQTLDFEKQIDDKILLAKSQQDIADPDVATALGAELRGMRDKFVQDHGGGNDSQSVLHSVLTNRMTGKISAFSRDAIGAQKAKVGLILGDGLEVLKAQVRADPENPDTLDSVKLTAAQLLQEQAGGLETQEEMAWARSASSQLGEERIDALFDMGRGEVAEQIIENEPGFMARLSLPAQQRVASRLGQYLNARNSGEQDGFAIRAELKAALGREPTDVEIQRKMGVNAPTGGVTAVPDETSASGFRFVPTSQAAGLEAPAPRPMLSLTNEETSKIVDEAGVAQGEIIADNLQNAQQGVATAPIKAQFRASLESGTFTPGALNDLRHSLASLGQLFGLPTDQIALIGSAQAADVMDSAADQLTTEIASRLSRVTNLSLLTIKNAVPSLSKTKDGNLWLLDAGDRMLDRDIALSAISAEMLRTGDHTLFPPDAPNYFERVLEYDKNNPVVTNEMKERFNNLTSGQPTTFAEAFSAFKSDALPDDFSSDRIPEDFEHLRTQPDGSIVIQSKTNPSDKRILRR